MVITSGGIGPTEDDLTRDIVAEVTGGSSSLTSICLSRYASDFSGGA